jgi:hypothetical protein
MAERLSERLDELLVDAKETCAVLAGLVRWAAYKLTCRPSKARRAWCRALWTIRRGIHARR